MPMISVVIPVFRNEGSLIPSYEQIHKVIREGLPEYDYEFLFTDDGSDDNSFNELMQIRARDPKVTVIKFSRNFGQFSAINAAMHRAKGDVAVCISADLQDPSEMIAQMARETEKGFDIVLANRVARNDNFIKNITAQVHFKLMRISTPHFPKGGFDFWMVSRKALNAYKQLKDTVRTNQVDLLSLGFKVKQLPYERKVRPFGKSQYNFSRKIKASINQLLSTSYWPLRLASSVGLFFTIVGFAYALFIIYGYFFRSTPFVGWAPIMVVQLIMGGIIISMLGLIGEYLWRIYHETKGRPIYIIDELYSEDSDDYLNELYIEKGDHSHQQNS